MKKLFSVNRLLAFRSLRHGLCVAVFGLAFAISPLYADVWHVDGKGDDSQSGTSPATAFRSLQKAASLTEPGDTVLVGKPDRGAYEN